MFYHRFCLISCLLSLLIASEGARYAHFSEHYVSDVGSFASNGNIVYLGAKNKILKLHFARRVFIAQFEVLSSECPPGNEECSDYTQHVLIADGATFQVNADRVLVTCGTHGGKPRCVMRDLGLLKSYMELPSLPHVATSSPYLKSLAKVHDQSFYYASYLTGDTSHPIVGRYNKFGQLTTKVDPRWFNHPQYVALQPIDHHMYIFYKELTLGTPSPILQSRVARVCLKDPGGNRFSLRNNFRTFTKSSITCMSRSTMAGLPDYTYNFIDGVAVPHKTLADVHQKDRTLYAIFSNIPNGSCVASAICSYNIKSMDASFQNEEFVQVDHLGMAVNHKISESYGTCENPRSLYNAQRYNLVKEPIQQSTEAPVYAGGCRKYTALAADRENGVDVLFVATDDMEFMKVAINKGKAYLVDNFKIRRESSPVTKIEKHPADQYVLASGPNYLLRIPIAQCRRFSDCNSCVGARDPYCGWCPIYNACVATTACPKSITNFGEEQETAKLCVGFRVITNNTRRAKKIRRRKKK